MPGESSLQLRCALEEEMIVLLEEVIPSPESDVILNSRTVAAIEDSGTEFDYYRNEANTVPTVLAKEELS